MLFSVPFFIVNEHLEEPDSFNFGLSLIYTMGGPETPQGVASFWNMRDVQVELAYTPLIQLYVCTDPNDPEAPVL